MKRKPVQTISGSQKMTSPPGHGNGLSGGGNGRPLRETAVKGDADKGKRDWHRDNNTGGAFIGHIEDFFTREELLAAQSAANEGKVGAPFSVPDCTIEWGMRLVVCEGIGYRSAAMRLSIRLKMLGFEGISVSQFFKRAGALKIRQGATDVTDARVLAYGPGARPGPDLIVGAMDSTGLSPDRASGWMVHHWNLKHVRGWYKLHTLVNTIMGEILSYVLTEPYYHDKLTFDRLYDIAAAEGHRFSTILTDATYDCKVYWNRLKEDGVEFIANIHGSLNPGKRNSSSGRFKGCAIRGRHVLRILEVGREKWKEKVGYSRRWRVEAVYSDLKRRFGDMLRTRVPERVRMIVHWLVTCYNQFKAVRKSLG